MPVPNLSAVKPPADRGRAVRPSRGRRLRETRAERRKREEGWDRRVALLWGAVLLVCHQTLPVALAPGSRHEYAALWNRITVTDATEVVLWALPVCYGVSALIVAMPRWKGIRGAVLLYGGLAVVLFTLLTAELAFVGLQTRTRIAFFGFRSNPSLSLRTLLVLAITLAPPLVAGTNRVLRRQRGPHGKRFLIGIGGVMLLLALFLPLGPEDRSILGIVFGGGEGAAADTYRMLEGGPLRLWLGLLLAYAVAAVLLPILRTRWRALADALSLLARILLWSLPAALLLARGLEPYVTLGWIVRLYAVMVLIATGWALVLGSRARKVAPPTA